MILPPHAPPGLEGEVVAEKCRNKPFGFGYNAATDTYEGAHGAGAGAALHEN